MKKRRQDDFLPTLSQPKIAGERLAAKCLLLLTFFALLSSATSSYPIHQ